MARKINHGRPTKCTPEMIENLSKYRRKMLPITTCCALAGCSAESWNFWMSKSEEGEPYSVFSEKIKRAEAKWLEEKLDQIDSAGEDRHTTGEKGQEIIIKGDWQARAWLTERLIRREFNRNYTRIPLDLNTDKNKEETQIQRIARLNDQIVRKMASGELSGEECVMACQVIEQLRKTHETAELSQKLTDLESRMK